MIEEPSEGLGRGEALGPDLLGALEASLASLKEGGAGGQPRPPGHPDGGTVLRDDLY